MAPTQSCPLQLRNYCHGNNYLLRTSGIDGLIAELVLLLQIMIKGSPLACSFLGANVRRKINKKADLNSTATDLSTTIHGPHYDDVIMTTMASQITSLMIVYSIVYSGADQRKHQSSASLAFVRGIHRGPVNSPHKWPVTRKMFPFDDVIMLGTHRCCCVGLHVATWLNYNWWCHSISFERHCVHKKSVLSIWTMQQMMKTIL